MKFCVFLLLTLFLVTLASAQEYIQTKEGRAILNRKQLVNNCLQSLNKNRSDKTALAICECQTAQLNRRFTNQQIKQHTRRNVIDLMALVKEDPLIEAAIQTCYTASGQSILLQAESFEQSFLSKCRKAIEGSSKRTLDAGRVSNFCQCQLEMVKEKKISDQEMGTLTNPNSILFYEMMYRCGSPYTGKEDNDLAWSSSLSADVKGPEADTVNVLTLNGMSYVKIKIGSTVQVWLFDTGASDLLINTETEAVLKRQGVLSEENFLGVGEYEMANGTVDSCRRYRINDVQIGAYSVDNVVVSVSEKAKRILVGKTLLNKFRHWSLDNAKNKLVFVK